MAEAAAGPAQGHRRHDPAVPRRRLKVDRPRLRRLALPSRRAARRPGTTADPNIVAVVASGGGLGAGETDIGFVPAAVADKLVAANAVEKVAVVVRRIHVNARRRDASATVAVDVIAAPAVRQAYGERVASEGERR